MDPSAAHVRISMDGGGGYLTVIANVFDPETPHSSIDKYIDTGVQRCQLICIVEDVRETNYNLALLLKRLQLDDVNYSLACDLKCANAVFGNSSHAGKFACLWCEGECSLERGEPRTIGSLEARLHQYRSDGSHKTKMKDFFNVINPRLV